MAMSNPYLAQQQFPGALQAANLPTIPPAYAHLLSQQQAPFPFLNQGKQPVILSSYVLIPCLSHD